eukprot:7045098-Pyramimonas_sp.AAC.1
MVRSIEKSVVRSMVRPIHKKIDQEPGNPGTSPLSEISQEPGTGNPGTWEPSLPPKSAGNFHQIVQHPLGPLQCKH